MRPTPSFVVIAVVSLLSFLTVLPSLPALVMGEVQAQSNEQVHTWMYENNLTQYESLELFRGEDSVTRGEISKFFTAYAKVLGLKKRVAASLCVFDDIREYDGTLKPYIIEACEYGLVKGFQGKYAPERPLLESEALAVAIRSILGLQDETGTPRWNSSYLAAREQGIIGNRTVESLDQIATRERVGRWLYRIANDISTNMMISTTLTPSGVSGMFADERVVIVGEGTYSLAELSPNKEFIAVQSLIGDKPRVDIFDAKTETLYRGKLGTFSGWTDANKARIDVCYPTSGLCEVYSSVNSTQPWIFPQVRALGNRISFACQDSQTPIASVPSNSSQKTLYLVQDGALTPITTLSMCSGVPPQDYAMHQIPEEAVLGVVSIQGNKKNTFYAIQENEVADKESIGPITLYTTGVVDNIAGSDAEFTVFPFSF